MNPETNDSIEPTRQGALAVQFWQRTVATFRADLADDAGDGRDLRASRAFLLVALLAGLFFVFLTPPTQALDEQSHFLRAWKLSELDIVTETAVEPATGAERNGSVYDLCVIGYMDEMVARAKLPDSFSFRDFWYDTPPCSPQRRAFVFTDAGTGYGPWAYPGQIVGLGITRALGLPLPVSFFAGRLGGLLFYIGLIWAALRITPTARLMMLLVGLLPVSLVAAAGYSADGVIIAGSILATACVLRLVHSEVRNPTPFFLLAAASLGLVVNSKQNYVVLLGLLFLIPIRRFGTVKRWLIRVGGASVLIFLISVLWYRFGQGVIDSSIFYPNTDPGQQARFVLAHPLSFLNVVWTTLFSYTYEVWFLRGWVGVFGMFRNVGRPSVQPLLPLPYVILADVMVAVALVIETGSRRALQLQTMIRRRVIGWGVVVVGPLLIFLGTFILWTPPGQAIIEGAQGRYMLPFLPVAAASISMVRKRSDVQLSTVAVSAASVVLLLAAIRQMWALFY